jgi:hypothetical protein
MVAFPMGWHDRNTPVLRSALRMLPHWEIAVTSPHGVVVGLGVVGVVCGKPVVVGQVHWKVVHHVSVAVKLLPVFDKNSLH